MRLRSAPRVFVAACVLPGLLAGSAPPATGSGFNTPGQWRLPSSPTGLPVSGLVAEGEVRPDAQIDTPGRHSAWIGNESGTFEAWAWPLKIVRDLRIDFQFRDRELRGADLARRAEVRPEWSAITYAHEAFTVTQVIASSIDRPANLMLLRVDASVPITLRVAFHPDLHPMWPAGLGGQYSYWDESLPGFVLGEGSGRNGGLIAAPGATEPTTSPAHSLPDQPTRFEIPVAAGHSGWIPLVVAGWKEGMDGDERGLAAMRPLYAEIVADPIAVLDRNVEHYRRVLSRQANVSVYSSAMGDLHEALQWAKVRLDQGLVCNPDLGCGMVAGYGGSGGGYRPGFAWFFGGDAFYNAWALTALGAHDTVRTALDMLARNQRADGKIMHELSQGAGTLNWFEDYPYGYYHAETSGWFIDTVVRHARATGDLEWARRMWPHVLRALEYCVSADSDGDGLMDNTAAGLGAVEMGALREARVHQDVYLAAVWTRAVTVLPQLARALGETATAERVETMGERARAALAERLDSPTAGWAFALGSDGTLVDEPSVWSVLPAALGVGDPERAARALRLVASPSITTDWGTRMLGSTSPLYDPLIYNQGTVWPFLTGFAAMAAYRHGLSAYGEDLLTGLVRLTEDHSRGAIHEVISGDRYRPMTPSVPHQLFSTASLATAVVEGMFGVEIDLLANEIRVAPRLPMRALSCCPSSDIGRIPVGDGFLSVDLQSTERAHSPAQRLRVRVTLEGWEGAPPTLLLAPQLPPLARSIAADDASIAGTPVGCATRLEPVETAWTAGRDGGWSASREFTWDGGIAWYQARVPGSDALPGGRSERGRTVACRTLPDDGGIEIDFAGSSGSTYEFYAPGTTLQVLEPALPVEGSPAAATRWPSGRTDGGDHWVTVPDGDGYRAATIRLRRSER